MNCQDCELILEEYLDGELDARRAAATETHLSACAACAEAYEALAGEQSMYARYERGVEVTPHLWGGIEERIAAPRRESAGKVGFFGQLSAWLAPLLVAPRFSPALTAALVLIAILGTAGVMRLMNGQINPVEMAVNNPNAQGEKGATGQQNQPAPVSSPESATPQPAPTTVNVNNTGQTSQPAKDATAPKKNEREEKKQPAPAPAALPAGGQMQNASAGQPARPQSTPTAAAADRLIREAEQRYVAAIRMLSKDVNGKRDKLDAQTLARFDETLASIDRTISETRRAVNTKNGDPVAVQYMLSAYAKKVEVLREMAQLEAR